MKRMIAAVLALVLLLGVLPVTVGAAGESGTKPVVYVYAQVVASDGKTPVTNAVGIVCNNSNWAVLGKLSSDAELMLQSGYSYAKGTAKFQTVTNEAESEKLTRYPVNAGVSLNMVTWDDLKCLSGTHDGYKGSVFADRTDANDGGSTAYHLDGTITAYKARFDANAEGTQTGNMPKDGYYLKGETITLPVPTRAGCTFAGWKVKDTSGEHDIAKSDNMQYTVGESDVTFTAQWERKVYVYAKIMASDGTTEVKDAVGVTYNGNSNWVTLGKLISDVQLPLKGANETPVTDQTLYYGVLGELSTNKFTRHVHNEVLSLDLVNWYELKYRNGDHDGYKGLNGDINDGRCVGYHLDGIITAYKVEFDGNGAEEQMPTTRHYITHETVPLPSVTREGYEFDGWKVNNNETPLPKEQSEYVVGTEDLTFTAQWTALHTVSFDLNGGDSAAIDPQTVRDGAQASSPTTVPTKTADEHGEFVFAGWYTVKENYPKDAKPFNFSTPITDDLTLYARWAHRPSDFEPKMLYEVRHVRQLPDGTYDEANAEREFLYAARGAAVTATPKDYGTHYSVNAAGSQLSGKVVEPALVNDELVYLVLTVRYDLDSHMVRFDPDGGTGGGTQTVRHGNAITRPGDPIRVGYRFEGWTKNGASYDFASPVEADFTLVAQWSYTGTLIDNILPLLPSLDNFGSVHPTLNTAEHFAYVNGYPDGSVKPQGNVTRVETAAILFRLMSEETRVANYSRVARFGDVGVNKWYNVYVATLDSAGVITDSANGYFRPNDAITRGELAAMLAQFAGETNSAASFRDTGGHWAASAIAKIASLGWIEGYPDGTFRPDQTVTRAELMAMMNRALGRNPQSTADLLNGMKSWTDNQNMAAWYYLDVQEATNSHAYASSRTGETWTALTRDPNWKQLEK